MTAIRMLSTTAILVGLLSGCTVAWFGPDATGNPAPEISASAWINAPSEPLTSLRGKVALIEFWTFGCVYCRSVEPHLEDWFRKYGTRGLMVIGVHTPETDFERNLANVEEYVRSHGISYPIAVVGDLVTWRRFNNRAWPTMYLVDKRGIVRLMQVGKGRYAKIEARIRALLDEDA